MGLEQQVRKGVAWMGLFQLVDRGVGLLSVAILARLLTPDDFGLVAIAAIFVAFLELIRAVGFDMALIQNQSAERRHYDTAWTFYVLCGAFSAIALVALSVPSAYFFDEPRLVGVLSFMAIGSLVGGFENIGVVAFRKELSFDREFRFQVSRRLITFVATICLALVFRNYWALVASTVVGRIVSVVISYQVHPYRPRFSLSAWRELFHFSKWLLLNSFNYYVEVRSAHFVLGGVSAGALGLFSVSEQLSRLPFSQIMVPINRAVFPGYAKLATELSQIRAAFLKVISTVSLLAIPVGVGIAATAELLVSLALGDEWLGAIPVIKVLALCGAFSAVNSNVHFVYVALGHVRAFWVLSGIYTLVLLPLVIGLALTYGAVGAGFAHLITAAICLPLFLWAAARKLELSCSLLLANLWRPVVSSAVMFAIVRAAYGSVTTEGSLADVGWLLALIALGVAAYSVVLLSLWQIVGRPEGAERVVLSTLSSFLAKYRIPLGTANREAH